MASRVDAIHCSGTNSENDKQNSLSVESSNACSHPVAVKQICITCGQQASYFYGLTFDYIENGFRLSETEANWLRGIETDIVLSKKKLILVLDLDETLLSTSKDLAPREKYLENHMNLFQDFFRLGNQSDYFTDHRFVKLRPFVRSFLEEASTLFEMYINTQSTRSYAKKMMSLLDPENRYFDSRLIAREDCTTRGQKHLDVVMGQERAIVILDDKSIVWPMHEDNLIQVQEYKYFADSSDNSTSKSKSESFAERKVDENASIMETYLQALKKIHSKFFDLKLEDDGANLSSRDVRVVMRIVKGEILQGCKLLLRANLADKFDHLQNMAEEMGAICVSKLDASVTHVVTMKSRPVADHQLPLADKKKKREYTYHLVLPKWINDSYKLWHRMPVVDYML